MKIILLGATGRIGAATLKALLSHPDVSSVVAPTRKELLIQHAKLNNIIHKDVTAWPDSLLTQELEGAGACIWTLGVRPSLIKSYQEGHAIEVEAPTSAAKAFIQTLAPKLDQGKKFRFIYVSGMASEKDAKRSLWFANDARKLKGETERELGRLNDESAELFEGYVAKSGHVVGDTGALVGSIAGLMPGMAIKESELAMAMIDIALQGAEQRTWDNAHLVTRGRDALNRLKP